MASQHRLVVAAFILGLAVAPSVSASGTGRGALSNPIESPAIASQPEEADTPQSFVSGPWRITIVEAVQSPAIEGVANNAPIGTEWAVVVADIANFSEEAAVLDPAEFSLGSGESTAQSELAVVIADVNLRAGPGTDTAILGAVLEGSTVTLLGESQNGFLSVESAGQQGWIFADFLSVGGSGASGTAPITVDLVASQAVATALDLEPSGEITVEPGDVQRVVAAFPVAAGIRDDSLVLGEESLPVVSEQRAALDPSGLPDRAGIPSLTDAELVTVTSGRSFEAQANGETTEIQLFGIDTPSGDECFASSVEDELRRLVNDGIALQPVEDQYLVWANVDGPEGPTLVNQALVAEGFAASQSEDNQSPYGLWLASSEAAAQADEVGLWGACTGVHGTEKPQPTPTPVPTPSAAEIRAEYPVLADVRELAIRPGNMLGDRVAFTGEILTIQVATPGDTFILGDSTFVTGSAAMQVWVTAPDGTREAVFVAYDGDTTGMFEGTWITVYGTVEGTQSGTNLMGGEISDPLVKAEIVDFA